MWKILIPSLIGCISIIGIYNDYQIRKKFRNDLKSKIRIGHNEIHEGTIFSNSTTIPIFKSKELSYDIPLDSPIHKIETRTRRYLLFHNYKSNTSDSSNSNQLNLVIEEYWETNTEMYHISSGIYFEDVYFEKSDITLKNNAIIHYTENKMHYVNNNKKILEKYIPNYSNVTIFGHKNNEGSYKVKIIGSRKEVIDDIAFRYYGISNSFTFLLLLISVSSVFSIFYFNFDN